MATFETQVEGLTQLTITSSSDPTQDELSDLLTSAAKDVINRILAAKPDEIVQFSHSSHDANNSGVSLNGPVLSVVREHDSTTILRPCTQIAPENRYEATRVGSLDYRSKYNPGWYILDGKVYTVPISASGNNDAIVTKIGYPAVSYSQTGIINFPEKYEYLVVYYAAMMALFAKAGSLHSDSDLTTALTSISTNIDSALSEISNLITELVSSKASLEYAGTLHKVESALDKVNKLFSDKSGYSGLSDVADDFTNSTSISGWLEEEDPEMVNTTIAAAASELKRAEVEMSMWIAKNKNSENYLKVAGGYGTAIDNYIKVANGYASKATARSAFIKQEYEWYMQRYYQLKSKYDDAFLSEEQIKKRKDAMAKQLAQSTKRKRR